MSIQQQNRALKSSPGAAALPCVVIAMPKAGPHAWKLATHPAGYLPALVLSIRQTRAEHLAVRLTWLIEASCAAVRDGNGRAALRYMDAAIKLGGQELVTKHLDALIDAKTAAERLDMEATQ